MWDKGETTLASLSPHFTLRAHSIPPEELKGYTREKPGTGFTGGKGKVSSHPLSPSFTDPPAFESWEKNLSYLLSVKKELVDNGYTPGEVSVPSTSFLPLFFTFLFSGPIFFAFYLWGSFFRPSFWIIPLCFIPLAGLIFYNPLWGMRVLGLLAGIVYPTSGVIILIDAISSGKGSSEPGMGIYDSIFQGSNCIYGSLPLVVPFANLPVLGSKSFSYCTSSSCPLLSF